ncbi:DAK2 domain-containing protein [Nostocoides sp. Soil756]|uniref:DAK2 domain-containing protein n=1 Tax=Nostocoides sp. Soil756 TaxID=1736399 RepID=UPI00070131D0|nr:DAK2 domain-containing protein [Tetrasphaera sp. Soil756]KRE61691.1 dihydroxyacetone kinase [Tetrasphaera sp. Soil756]
MPDVFTADDARHWVLLTRAALAARRAEIDELNVFPVPDGDTGTNLYLTLDGAIEDAAAALRAEGGLGPADLVRECTAMRRAVLMAARGNSGVLLSQLIGGLCDVVTERRLAALDAGLLAECLERGAGKARASVAHPQEGTILTVADAAALAARATADDDGTLAEVSGAAVAAAQQALIVTPHQLPALARAGVVDAGGAGCVLLLESLHRVVTGAWTATDEGLLSAGPPRPRDEWRSDAEAPAPAAETEGAAGPGQDGPAFEVMYLLTGASADTVATLTATLDRLGDSLLVVGGPDLWNVHVHVDDAGAAVEAGILAGRPERVRITHLVSQGGARDQVLPLGVVAGAAGPGIAALLEAAGAVAVPFGPGRRPSASQLVDAARRTGAPSVVLLPADADGLMVAEIAARAATGEGLEVHVVPARTTVQALAALAVLDPERTVHANVVAMTGAAVSTRHGAVTVATEEALTWAGVCHPGDVLGIVDGDVALLAGDLVVAAHDVLDRMLSAGGELVTLVVGEGADTALADRVAARLGRERPEVEVVVIDGGQPVHPLLIGVE